MEKNEQIKISGGFWQVFLSFLPLIVESFSTVLGTIKAVASENGKVKTKNSEIQFDNKKESSIAKSANSKSYENNTLYFTY